MTFSCLSAAVSVSMIGIQLKLLHSKQQRHINPEITVYIDDCSRLIEAEILSSVSNQPIFMDGKIPRIL